MLISLVTVLCGLMAACTKYTYDPDGRPLSTAPLAGDCNTDNPTFETDIAAILEDHCIDCHNTTTPMAGYDYTNYDQLIQSALSGSLLGTVEYKQAYSAMPPAYQLSDCSIEMIKRWMQSEGMDTIPGTDTTPEVEESDCDPDTAYFVNSVLPLVVSSCATTNCHDVASHKDGIILTDHEMIRKTGKIKPGDPNDSEFFETLTENGDDRMPPLPYARLDADQIELLRKWIQQGAKNNACSEACDPENSTFEQDIWPMMQTYCTGCHSATNPGGGIAISDHSDLVALADDGSLMGSIRNENGFKAMPPNKSLSDCQIHTLQHWIDEGYPQ